MQIRIIIPYFETSIKNQTMEKQIRNDRLFIQEIINDLEKHGYQQGGKAQQMLRDWSGELRQKSHLTGRTKKVFFEEVGAYLW